VRKGRPPKDAATVETVAAGLAAGKTAVSLAAEHGISRETIRLWLRKPDFLARVEEHERRLREAEPEVVPTAKPLAGALAPGEPIAPLLRLLYDLACWRALPYRLARFRVTSDVEAEARKLLPDDPHALDALLYWAMEAEKSDPIIRDLRDEPKRSVAIGNDWTSLTLREALYVLDLDDEPLP
jgi:hypothetical protein